MSHPGAAYGAVDWGTSSFRIWLLDAAGRALAERRSGEGMVFAREAGFSTVLERHLAEMSAPAELPVIICGMAGARQGWLEAPYVPVPAAFGDLFDGAVAVPDGSRRILILPGIAQRDAVAPDVMRGEETQLAGIAGRLPAGRQMVCMPGTHSKWVEITEGAVTRFGTWMTGELFAVLSQHSILRHSVAGATAATAESPAFRHGLEDGLGDAAGLGRRLFGLRAAGLLHGLDASDSAAGLSGLLIGAEIASAGAQFATPGEPLNLVASGGLGILYAAALRQAGHDVRVLDADEAVRAGLQAAAAHHGLTSEGERT